MLNLLDLIVSIYNTLARALSFRKPPEVTILPLAAKKPYAKGFIWPSSNVNTGLIWTPSKDRLAVALDGTTRFRRRLARIIGSPQARHVPPDHHKTDSGRAKGPVPLDSPSRWNPTTQAAKPASFLAGDQTSLALPVSGQPLPDTPQGTLSMPHDSSLPQVRTTQQHYEDTSAIPDLDSQQQTLNMLLPEIVQPSAPTAPIPSQQPITPIIALPQQSPHTSNSVLIKGASVSWLSVLSSSVRALWAWLRSWFAAGEEVEIFHVAELREILVR